MGPVQVARDMVEFKTRVELYGPLLRHEIMRRDRELGKRKAASCTPKDDAATILRGSVNSGLQDAEAHLIAVRDIMTAVFEKVLFGGRGGTYPSDVSVRRMNFTIP